ncbi:MAG: ABC transporter ATP-binding protein [Gammaproteobacteria bacterium]|nr:MAG: ABC transporter ATP-binding protein [Gammaproteobacteria bacterium]
MNGPVICLASVKMRMGGEPLLDVARFELPAGSCTILSGRNGAGKTTLLKIAAGLMKPDKGTVQIGDAGVDWPSARPTLRKHSIYMHQHAYMFDTSVADNVAYGLRKAGVPVAQRNDAVGTALEWAGLAPLAARNARHLSGGERQRLALARARVLSPAVLLLDEPTTNMDSEARQQSFFLIRRLVSEGTGVVIASHDRQIIGQLGDQHLHLADGRLLEMDVAPASARTRTSDAVAQSAGEAR